MKAIKIAAVFGFVAILAPKTGLALDLLQGQRVYNMHCAVCHGVSGIPVIVQAPSFAARERLMQPDMMLLQSVKMGKTVMPPFMGILKDEEILDAIQYARTLR